MSDRLKACLPNGPLNYVLSLEGNEWFTPDKVATLADIFVNNQKQYATTAPPRTAEYRPTARVSVVSANYGNRPGSPRVQRYTGDRVKRCFQCQSPSHLARACPRGRGRGYNPREYHGRVQGNMCTTGDETRVKELGVQYTNDEGDGDQREF